MLLCDPSRASQAVLKFIGKTLVTGPPRDGDGNCNHGNERFLNAVLEESPYQLARRRRGTRHGHVHRVHVPSAGGRDAGRKPALFGGAECVRDCRWQGQRRGGNQGVTVYSMFLCLVAGGLIGVAGFDLYERWVTAATISTIVALIMWAIAINAREEEDKFARDTDRKKVG